MPRVALDLNKAEDRRHVKGEWRVAAGLVPGEPNEGLTAQLRVDSRAPGRSRRLGLGDLPQHSREPLRSGFTFAWYRISGRGARRRSAGSALAGSRVWFETNIDNYGEIWIDGKIDRSTGVIVGLNAQHRVEVSGSAVAGAKHVIACLVRERPLWPRPRGGIFLRYATLAFESPG